LNLLLKSASAISHPCLLQADAIMKTELPMPGTDFSIYDTISKTAQTNWASLLDNDSESQIFVNNLFKGIRTSIT
jgi:hypothetical protein